MQFIVPQFIDKKSKIVGPFTFGELVFMVIVGAICLFLFFTINFTAFVVSAIFLVGFALALVFVKIEGNSLPTVLKNFFVFLFNKKIYLWKKKTVMTTIKFESERFPENDREGANKKEEGKVRAQADSKLNKLLTEIETRAK